jgi:hypothetical protein
MIALVQRRTLSHRGEGGAYSVRSGGTELGEWYIQTKWHARTNNSSITVTEPAILGYSKWEALRYERILYEKTRGAPEQNYRKYF